MSEKKHKADQNGFVYSTDPDFNFENPGSSSKETLPASQQKLKIKLDTRHRAGKAVTLTTGFVGTESDLQELGKKLKNFCGTGGSVKEGAIIVQGDQRDKVLQWFQNNGFKQAKKI